MAGRLSIVIPCCNEEDAIRLLPERLYPVLHELLDQYEVEVVLVDDGSSDNTWQELLSLQSELGDLDIVLGKHAFNRGLGAALSTGWELTSGEIVVTLDVDGTYPFGIIDPLVTAVEKGADVATASPYHPDGGVDGVSALRLTFSRGASLCYRALVDPEICTYTAMVRAYRRDVLEEAISDEPGFLQVAMTLVEARRRGATVVEIPAVLAQREVGTSKAKVARITRAHLGYMRRIAWQRATGKFWLDGATEREAQIREVA